MQVLEWENMLERLDEDHPERAHFTCPSCHAAIEEHHRPKMLKGAEWRSANPAMKRVHRSFYLWSAYSLLQSFERIARSWLAAKGDPPKEQTFMNDVVGKAYRVLGEAPPWEDLRDRAAESDYHHGQIPAGFPIFTCGVDCQSDRVEWQAVAFGRNKQRAIVAYGVIDGHISEEKCHKALNALLKREFKNAYGRKLTFDLVGIDGNAYTEDVWEWSRKHPASKVIMLRGIPSETAPLLARVKRERNRRGEIVRYSRRFYNFATSILKMGLYRNLKKTDPTEVGFVALPKGLEDEFFRQLTAETRKVKKTKTGYDQYLWVKDPNQNNEGLDTHLQAEAAAIRLNVRSMIESQWDAVFADRECPPEEVQGDFEDLLTPLAPTSAPEDPEPKPKAKTDGRAKWRKRTQ